MSDVFIFCGTFSDGKSDKDQMNTSCQYKLKNLSYFKNLIRFKEISILEKPCKNCKDLANAYEGLGKPSKDHYARRCN